MPIYQISNKYYNRSRNKIYCIFQLCCDAMQSSFYVSESDTFTRLHLHNNNTRTHIAHASSRLKLETIYGMCASEHTLTHTSIVTSGFNFIIWYIMCKLVRHIQIHDGTGCECIHYLLSIHCVSLNFRHVKTELKFSLLIQRVFCSFSSSCDILLCSIVYALSFVVVSFHFIPFSHSPIPSWHSTLWLCQCLSYLSQLVNEKWHSGGWWRVVIAKMFSLFILAGNRLIENAKWDCRWENEHWTRLSEQ